LWDTRTETIQGVLTPGDRSAELDASGMPRTGMLTSITSKRVWSSMQGGGGGWGGGTLVVGGYEDGSVRVWDMRKATPLVSQQVKNDAVLAACAVQSKDKLVLVAAGVGTELSFSHLLPLSPLPDVPASSTCSTWPSHGRGHAAQDEDHDGLQTECGKEQGGGGRERGGRGRSEAVCDPCV
jgi:hypothetical protein